MKVATNAYGPQRLGELCLMWISLKLPETAQPIYSKCKNKDTDWDLLKSELEEGLEDPKMRRDWVRNVGAYKKPKDISLQVYRAKVTGYVHKYSPAVVNDPKAYNEELYNRFVHGLEVDWREYIEESIPYGKETIDNAYNQAMKYEARLEKKEVKFTGAAMTGSEKNSMERIRQDLEEMKTELASTKKKNRQERGSWSGFQREDRRSRTSSSSSSSTGTSRSSSDERFRAVSTEEDSDTELVQERAKVMTLAISKAITEGMKDLTLKGKKSSSKRCSRTRKH